MPQINLCHRLVAGVVGVIDQLTYYFDDAVNPDRLTRVVDAGSATKGFVYAPPASGNHYLYDAAGNLTEDKHKKFTVAYNHLNLPRLLTFTDGSGRKIEFTYTAGGTKLTQRAMTNSTVNSLKNYVGGIEYNGANTEAIYHDDGRLVPNGATAWYYEYSLRDHLGNARVNFRANGTAPQFLDEHHYYPFGMEMEGFAGGGSPYRYNNKEITADFGVNWYFYGARWYDAAVGRWWSVDPLAEKYVAISSYHYGLNNPVRYLDLFGMSSSDPNEVMQERKEKAAARKEQTDQEVNRRMAAQNGQKDMPVLWIANVGKVSMQNTLIPALNVAGDIFSKNGYDKITYKFVSTDEAMKHELAYEYQAFLAIRNDDLPSRIGLSDIDPSGRIGVFRKDGGHPQRSWKSYVNLTSSVISKNPDPIYAAGYIIAHEYLHQVLALASFYREGDMDKFQHNDTELNLNMRADHTYFVMPRSSSANLQKAERILKPEKDYLDYFFQIKR